MRGYKEYQAKIKAECDETIKRSLESYQRHYIEGKPWPKPNLELGSSASASEGKSASESAYEPTVIQTTLF